MQSLKASFEKELMKKLSQKSGGHQSDEAVLMKAFKYFDLNNNGTVEPEEFAKAVEKIGIMIPTKQDLDALFNIYDKDQSGGIEYKEFAQEIFGHAVNASTPTQGSQSPDDLLDRLRKKLASRGARGIIGLSKQFRIMDDNHSMELDKYEFSKAMQDFMLGFSEGEVATLFRTFDYDNSGLISYDEFLCTVRGPMSPYRKSIVVKAFAKLDKDGNGYIDINDLKGVYNASKHPDVLSGKKTEDQILQEWLETFEVHHSMRTNGAPDHIVTKEEFDKYYDQISASIDDDQYFALMMNNAWNLDGSRVTKKAWGSGSVDPITGRKTTYKDPNAKPAAPMPQMNYSDAQLVDRFRGALIKRGERGIMGIGRAFRLEDKDKSGSLCKDEFQKAVHDFRVGITPQDSDRLFKIWDTDRQGNLSYDEFLRGVVGDMNDHRKGIAMQAFAILDIDKSGELDLTDIKHFYNAKKHPKVISGEKTEDEILWEFMDTFEQHHADLKNSDDHIVTKEDWIEYYNKVSMSIDDDAYFDLMMNNAWNLDGKRVTKKGWGGAI